MTPFDFDLFVIGAGPGGVRSFADTVFGGALRKVDYACIPTAVFSHPPLASVGMTEAEARNKMVSIRVYMADFRAMKNVLATATSGRSIR